MFQDEKPYNEKVKEAFEAYCTIEKNDVKTSNFLIDKKLISMLRKDIRKFFDHLLQSNK